MRLGWFLKGPSWVWLSKLNHSDLDHRFWYMLPLARATHVGVTLFLTHSQIRRPLESRVEAQVDKVQMEPWLKLYMCGNTF